MYIQPVRYDRIQIMVFLIVMKTYFTNFLASEVTDQ